jgi:hypothetical protein
MKELKQLLSFAVKEDGTLDDTRVTCREQLYIGSNGKAVERFAIQADSESALRTFIFKPLTNVETIGREAWLHEYVISLLPQVRTPKLLSFADHMDPLRFWFIFEDCGPLDHRLHAEHVAMAASLIPTWHALPARTIPPEFSGNKPGYRLVAEQLQREWDRLAGITAALGMTEQDRSGLEAVVRGPIPPQEERLVVSHGDFHRGNLAALHNGIVVLDWEHAHLNSPYWDLYHLLDMTHPRIRREIVHPARMAALNSYLESADRLGCLRADNESAFVHGYYRFCAVYSAWMLLLIENDLAKGVWEQENLLEAQRETYESLTDSLRYMSGKEM